MVESPSPSGHMGLCAPAESGGMQKWVLALSKLVVSAERIPIAKESNVSPWCLHLDLPSPVSDL